MRRLARQPRRLWDFVLSTTREICMRIFLVIVLFTGYLACSMIAYAAMRHILVPQKTHILPVHLYFNPVCTDGSYVFDKKSSKKQSVQNKV
jgi:hypothetical protein